MSRNFLKFGLAYWLVVVVLPYSTETQQSGHVPRFGTEVKHGRSSAKDGAPERLGCGNREGGELDPAEGSACAARKRILQFYPA